MCVQTYTLPLLPLDLLEIQNVKKSFVRPLNVHENINSTIFFKLKTERLTYSVCRGMFCKLGSLHKEEVLLKSLITYTFIV